MSSAAADCIRQLCSRGLGRAGSMRGRVLVAVAHPDDETIGLGSRLKRLRDSCDVLLAYTTDGAPRNGRDAARCGHSDAAAYALTRRRELESALELAGLAPQTTRGLGCPDQEGWRNMPRLARGLARLMAGWRPRAVITHPYEGGHPDHDATAFAAHAACAMLRRRLGEAPGLVEMTSYHRGPEGIRTGGFLDASAAAEPVDERPGETEIEPRPEERGFKERLFDCFETQRETLAYFGTDVERFRVAPRYNFAGAPHSGPLFYESFDWGATGAGFRRAAAGAMRQCRIAGAI